MRHVDVDDVARAAAGDLGRRHRRRGIGCGQRAEDAVERAGEALGIDRADGGDLLAPVGDHSRVQVARSSCRVIAATLSMVPLVGWP